MGENPDQEGPHAGFREEEPGNPPVRCDHRPPKVATLPAEGGVRVQCLGCGTVGPERAGPGEAFRALLKIPYRANRSDLNSTCVVANQNTKGARGAFESRTAAVLRPLL